MKAWRLHNMQQTAKIKQLQIRLDACNHVLKLYPYASWYKEEAEKLQEKIKQTKGFYLRTKTERRGQFAAEVVSPSQLLWKLFKHAGYQVPEALS